MKWLVQEVTSSFATLPTIDYTQLGLLSIGFRKIFEEVSQRNLVSGEETNFR